MTPMVFVTWGVAVHIGCVFCSISSLSNCSMSEAWKAAPRAVRVDGSRAVVDIDGAIMVALSKMRARLVAIRGVWDVPPARMI